MANPVIEVIKRRHRSGSLPNHRDDPYKVALTVEGGGMRGVVGGGAMAVLEALNLRPAFDTIYGSSSGAYSAAFFAGGDVMTGASFYLDYAQHQFISWHRALSGGTIFDLDYVKQILHSHTPLNYRGVINNTPPLHIIATDVDHTHPIILKNFEDSGELDRALQSSANVPSYFHPKARLFHHRHLLDGSVMDPFGIHSAISEKNTHILVLFSMPWRNRHLLKIVDKRLLSPYLSKLNPHLAEMFLQHGEYSFNALSHIWNHYDGTHIALISPKQGDKFPKNLTTDRQKVGEGFLTGARAALHALEIDDKTQYHLLQSFKRELRI